MKKKNKKSVLRKKKEFRYHNISTINKCDNNRLIRHPAYVFYEKGNIFIYVSITHSSKVDNVVLIKLRKNPNPKDKNDSFWIAEVKEDTKDRFGRRLLDWNLDEKDDLDIRNKYKKR